MTTRLTYKALLTTAMLVALSLLLAAPTAATAARSKARPASDQTSTVFDPVGDTFSDFNAPFEDFVGAQMTRTDNGDFRMLMEMAAPVPANPPLRPGVHELWWFWIFDLDPDTRPNGYPWHNA